MATYALAENEVLLDDYRLPIRGRVQVSRITQEPGKITIGKTRRADQTLADEWVQDEWSGGMFIKQMDEEVHRERYWWGTVDALRRRKIMLPPYVNDLGNPTTAKTAPEKIWEFGNYVYASFGGKIHRWQDNSSDWSAQLVDIGANVTDTIVFKTNLYVAYANGYYKFDGTTWTDNTEDASYFTIFDTNPNHKLMKIDSTGLIKASTDGTTWSTDIGGEIEDRTITGMLVFRNPADEPLLVVCTDTGLYSVNVWTKTVYETSLKIIKNDKGGVSSFVWSDGHLYFPDGLAVWKYPRAGQISNVGLDRDDGIPSFMQGKITGLTGTPNYLVMCLDSSVAPTTNEEDLFLGMEFGVSTIPLGGSGYSGVFLYSGTGVHCIHKAGNLAAKLTSPLFSVVYGGDRRLFWIEGTSVKWMRFPEGNYDPSEDENAEFDNYGEFITSWMDAGRAELRKVWTSLKLRGKGITSTETVEVYYATDDNENTWTYLGVMNDTTVNANGRAKFTLASGAGITFYTLRLKFVFRRASDDDKGLTPILLFFDARYKMLLSALYGWSFTVASTDDVFIQNMWEAIKDVANQGTLIPFAFRIEDESVEYVKVLSVTGVRYSSRDNTSYFSLTVAQLEPDTEVD